MRDPLAIGHVDVGEGLPCLLIAEIGLNHNGSLELAHRLIDAAALSGASMVKFQKRSPADLARADFLDAPFHKCPLFGRTQREVRARLELPVEALAELKAHAYRLGLLFSASFFDLPSLDAVVRLSPPVLKVPSHAMTNGPLLEAAARAGLPIIASVGGCTWEERDLAVGILGRAPLAILHCVSAYPCPDHLVKLDTIAELRRRYGCVVGYSGHEAGIEISVAAAALGARIVERHLTLSRSMVGLDHAVSLLPEEFAEMARQIRRLERVRGTAESVAAEEMPSRLSYHVAVCASRDLAAGETIDAGALVCRQPLADPAVYFTGLEAAALVGRRVAAPVGAGRPIPRASVE